MDASGSALARPPSLSPALTAGSATRAVLRTSGLRLMTGHALVPMPLVESAIRHALKDVEVVRSFSLAAHAGFADLAIVVTVLGNPLTLDAPLAITRARINGEDAELLLSVMAPPALGIGGLPETSQFARVLDALQRASPDDFSDLTTHDLDRRLFAIDFDRIPSLHLALEHKFGGARVRDLFSISRAVVTDAGIVVRFDLHWRAILRALIASLTKRG